MARTVAEAEAWARQHPRKTVGAGGPSWSGWCAALMYWACGFERSFDSAMAAGDASGRLDGDYRTAQRGDLHYWAGVGGDGHVALDLGGDGTDRLLLMASNAVTDSFGLAIGAVWMSQYKKLGIPYRGHSPRWGNETMAGALAPAPVIPTISEDDMADRGEVLLNFRHTDDGKNRNNTIYFRSPARGIIAIRNPYELALLNRNCELDRAKTEVMFPAEIAMINYYLVAPTPQATVVDTAFLTKTVKDTLEAIGKTLTVDADLSEDDIKLISKAVNDEFAKRVAA